MVKKKPAVIVEETRQGYVISCPICGGSIPKNSQEVFFPLNTNISGEYRCRTCNEWFIVSEKKEK